MRMEEEEGLYYIRQLVEAVSYIHSKRVIHRDLKSENMLLSRVDGSSQYVLKLCDFGWSNVMTHEKRMSLVGTLEYLAPEVLKSEAYTQKVDIWSIAVIIHELFTGRTPFEPAKSNLKSKKERICEIQNNILNSTIKLPGTIPPGARDLLKKMFKRNPENRFDIDQVREHWWIKGEPHNKDHSIVPAKSDENDPEKKQSIINQPDQHMDYEWSQP